MTHEHKLYETGHIDVTPHITDSNGEVVLGQCMLCGKAEIELMEHPECPGPEPMPDVLDRRITYWRHKKTGNLYGRVHAHEPMRLQIDDERYDCCRMVVYVSDDTLTTWVRPLVDFLERFEQIGE
jgi:hypothetical protein